MSSTPTCAQIIESLHAMPSQVRLTPQAYAYYPTGLTDCYLSGQIKLDVFTREYGAPKEHNVPSPKPQAELNSTTEFIFRVEHESLNECGGKIIGLKSLLDEGDSTLTVHSS